ncbi:NAD-dependent epimerase/dehydratase family protein [Escherichia coli]|nr:NAD-dependent epimerase/dehydratase family protein [Escherichia coli]
MNDNVLLIGASGFVGTRLLETAIADFNIKNLDKQQSHFYPEITQIGDVRDQQALDQALAGFDTVVLLAAEHRDDVSPTSLYYDVNVQGTRNVLAAMERNGVKNIIFTSSVAVYGLNKHNPDENHPHDPFNHYGKSKWQAEEVLREWYNKAPTERSLTIIRPTVIFGERNRGNVYNLLKQIAGGKFMNYVDKPDLNMNQLVAEVEQSLNKKIPSMHLPYPLGMLGGYCFDILSKIMGKKYAVSSVRVKKFCATTQFDATKVHSSGFVAPYTLSQGLDRTLQYEFVHAKKDDITFVSE